MFALKDPHRWLVGCYQNVTSNAKNNAVIQLAPVSGVDVVLQKKMQLGMSVCTSCTKSSEASVPSLEKTTSCVST